MRSLTLFIVCCTVLPGLIFAAQKKTTNSASQAQVVFKIRTHGAVQGSEEYTISSKGAKHVLTSNIHLKKMGELISSTQQETLAADWSPLDYSLKTTIGKQERSTEATVSVDSVHMRSASQGDVKDKSVRLSAPAWVIDNVVPSHFQVLISQYKALQAQHPVQFQLLMPQVLADFAGTMSSAGTETGTFLNHGVQLQKYVLQTRGLNLQIWADSHGRLMRVYLPEQDTEFLRVGFSAGQAVSASAAQSGSAPASR